MFSHAIGTECAGQCQKSAENPPARNESSEEPLCWGECFRSASVRPARVWQRSMGPFPAPSFCLDARLGSLTSPPRGRTHDKSVTPVERTLASVPRSVRSRMCLLPHCPAPNAAGGRPVGRCTSINRAIFQLFEMARTKKSAGCVHLANKNCECPPQIHQKTR